MTSSIDDLIRIGDRESLNEVMDESDDDEIASVAEEILEKPNAQRMIE
jgi:hypothetical protein